MILRNITIVIITSLFLSYGWPVKILKKVNKEIESTYNVEHFELISVIIPDDQKKVLPSQFGIDNIFIIKSGDNNLGFAYISKAPSKTAQFDYLILLDRELVVKKAKVLIYREEYGGEIGSKRWLKQFVGKTPQDELIYEQNIVAISGATISVRSMTTAVNDVLKSLKILRSKHIL